MREGMWERDVGGIQCWTALVLLETTPTFVAQVAIPKRSLALGSGWKRCVTAIDARVETSA